MTGRDGVPTEFFHAIYTGSVDAPRIARSMGPPWDIGRAQADIDALIAAGELRGHVLDVGTGPGHNAIAIARTGAKVFGIDLVPAAVAGAQAAADAAGVEVELAVADALDLAALGRRFDAAVDSGTFHVFSDADRLRYASSLASVLEAGGALHLLCFSDEGPPRPGPRRISRAELQATFKAPAFEIARIMATRFVTRAPDGGAPAWLVKVVRLGSS